VISSRLGSQNRGEELESNLAGVLRLKERILVGLGAGIGKRMITYCSNTYYNLDLIQALR